MTTTELTNATKKLGIRKNNTLQVGAFTITKWGADRFQVMQGETGIMVGPLSWVVVALKKRGAVSE